MLVTQCSRCCFFVSENSACGFGYDTTLLDGKSVALGCCRDMRSISWLKRYVSDWKNKLDQETSLKIDTIVLFDDDRHRLDDLSKTINSNRYGDIIFHTIIADVTGSNNRLNTALNFVRSGCKQAIVDMSMEKESPVEIEDTIRRIHKQFVKSPFFLVVEAGNDIPDLFIAQQTICKDHRSIHWYCSETDVLSDGIFLSRGYGTIMSGSSSMTFTQRLRSVETEMEVELSRPLYESR